MNKRTREIIALVLLVLLGAVVLATMAWYIFIGHNWNVAASNIDETIGEMEGYTVLLYEGQTTPESERNQISNAQPLLDDENRGASKPRRLESAPETPVDISEVASLYRQKGATVFILHPERTADYVTPTVLNKNGFWLGMFTVDGSMSHMAAQIKAQKLQSRGIAFAVAVVQDARLIDDPVSSVDILLCIRDEDLSSHGEYHGSTFCVDSPYVGQVQTIIISPSGVLTTKTISSL